MRITQEGDYALRVVLYLYKIGVGHRIEAKVIADHENVPKRFLLKLLRKLAVAGIVKSYMGYGGGYVVEKPASQTTFKAVIEAVEGPIIINKCLEDASQCNVGRAPECEVHKALNLVQSKLTKQLEDLTFQKLLDEYSIKK